MEKQIKKKTIAGYTMIVVGITALLCILVFLFLGYRFFLKPEIEFEEDQSIGTSVTQSDKISIPGFETWTIDAGETKVSAGFYNPEQNGCYFVISVIIDETGETIYESKYLKPDSICMKSSCYMLLKREAIGRHFITVPIP